jgi:hypothetical protein
MSKPRLKRRTRKLRTGRYQVRVEQAELSTGAHLALVLRVAFRVVRGPSQGTVVSRIFPIIAPEEEIEYDRRLSRMTAPFVGGLTPTMRARCNLKILLDICGVNTTGPVPISFVDDLLGKVMIADVVRGRLLTVIPCEEPEELT